MSYKKTKKTPGKQKREKKTHLIPDELIKSRHFTEIVNRVSESSELTNRDQYIYGYSLLKKRQYLEALVTLWPLAAKGHAKLQEDCAVIAAYVFADESRLFSVDLSDDAIYKLFCAGKNLAPQSVAYYALKKHLFDTLWQQGDFEKLERILKSSKKNREESSGVSVENLGKLGFFQPNRKLTGNIPAFVGHVLTGGACLIVRDSIYHDDIANEVRLLADEVKYLFYQLKIKNQPLAWDKTLFENFVDYEASVLTRVLQMVVKNSSEYFDIIPTPSYLMHYDATTKRGSEKFLLWLASKNKELFEAYNADTYYTVLWAIGGAKTPGINKILKSVFSDRSDHSAHKDSLSPYLRLAIMLRSINMKKTSLGKSLGELVQLSDFVNFKQTTSVFKEVALQTVKSMVNNQANIKLPAAFWQLLFEFYPILQDPDCRNMLVAQLIEKLEKEYADQRKLDVNTLKNIAHKIDAHDLAKQAEVLCIRQQACAEFLSKLKNDKYEKKSKKIVENIKDETALRAHLTLIADCYFLVHTELSTKFFQHVKSIVLNKRINKLISLMELFYCGSNCTCPSCQEMLYLDEIPSIAKELNLPIARIPDIYSYAYIQPSSKTQKTKELKSSIFSQNLSQSVLQTDPFKILGVSLTDSKQVIMQKVMQLIQQSPDRMAVYRQAQSELFNPARRFLHQYLRYLNYEDNNIENSAQQVSPASKISLHEIPLRQEFL